MLPYHILRALLSVFLTFLCVQLYFLAVTLGGGEEARDTRLRFAREIVKGGENRKIMPSVACFGTSNGIAIWLTPFLKLYPLKARFLRAALRFLICAP